LGQHHTFIVDSIPFQPDIPGLLHRLRIKEGSSYVADVQRLVDEAQAIARPKAMYRLSYVDAKGDDTVVIDGITFKSRVLRVNLDAAHRVFAFIATCGAELQAWSHTMPDVLYEFWADVIKEAALRDASQALNHELETCYELGRTSTMNPGSLADWPIREQRPLFALLGDPRAAIGVELTDSYLMVPNKTVSGIRFPSEEAFANCQLCPRENCPGRRAPYDATAFERKYAQSRQGSA
jgi:hypothetical protein